MLTGSEILRRAHELEGYCYWYGGKRNRCTQALLNEFAKQYKNIYTATYIAKCKVDIANNRWCVDCSGLVCYAYNRPNIGSYQMPEKYSKWTGTPRNGMILHRNGHVGLYENGFVLEARGIDYDVTNTRKYIASEWQNVLYDPSVDYNEKKYSIGWHKDEIGWWYADSETTYCKDGYYNLPWSGDPSGKSKFYFDKRGYCICTDNNSVIVQPIKTN